MRTVIYKNLICYKRANHLKSNATLEELILIVKDAELWVG